MSTRTPRHAAVLASGRRALPVLGLTVLALLAGLPVAGPAAAIDDTTRPDARVTHGPSCRPGGVVVEVVAGTAPYAVTLATTRIPDGEDSAEVASGRTVVLRTGEVAWGETVDGWLEYRALDGSGDTWVDELDGYTFTRPAEEDCAAITAPAAAATVPAAVPAGVPATPGTTAEVPAEVAVEVPGEVPVSPHAGGGGSAGTPGAARVIVPGGPAPTAADDETVVETIEVAAAAPVPLPTGGSSPAALFAAVVALSAATAGLAGALGVPGLRRRRPTPGA